MIGFKTASTLLATAAAVSFAPMGSAQAITLNASGPFCSNTDVSPTAVACSGSYDGNTNDSNVLTTLTGAFGGTWSFNEAEKSDSAGAGAFKSNVESTFGTLEFDNSIFGKFVIGLKASNNVSFYLLDGGTTGLSSFDFNTIGTSTNSQNTAQNLSHAALYRLETGTPIPTPALLPGLIGMGVAALRKRKGDAQESAEALDI